jgi:hypothetical protein
MKKKNLFATLQSVKKGVGSGVGSGSGSGTDQDPFVRCMDPGIRIRTKMSQIPNTVLGKVGVKMAFVAGLC